MSRLESITNINDMKNHFETKVERVQRLVDLSCILKCDDSRHLHDDIYSQLDVLDDILDKMEAEINKRKEIINSSEKLMVSIRKVNEVVDSSPSMQIRNLLAPQRVSMACSLKNNYSEERKHKKISLNEYMEEYENETGYKKEMSSSLSKDDVKIHPTLLLVTEMTHLHEPDLAGISKLYLKSRMKLDKINSTVDALNQACASKYEILRTPKSKYTEKIRSAIRDFREQENKDTEGYNFIVEKDISTFTDLKLDKLFYSIVTVLRFSGRLKEVRGQNLLRYVFLNSR